MKAYNKKRKPKHTISYYGIYFLYYRGYRFNKKIYCKKKTVIYKGYSDKIFIRKRYSEYKKVM